MRTGVTIKPNQLSLYVMNELNEEYGRDLQKAAYVAADETAQQLRDELKTAGSFKGRKYRNSWSYEIEQNFAGAVRATVFNKKHYRLTHLLEFGHAKQNGGRTREFPHIAPINERAPEIFTKKLEAILGYRP